MNDISEFDMNETSIPKVMVSMRDLENKNITNDQKMNVMTQEESIQINRDIMNKQITKKSTDIGTKHLEMHHTFHPSDISSNDSDTSTDDEILYQRATLTSDTLYDYEIKRPNTFSITCTNIILYEICNYYACKKCVHNSANNNPKKIIRGHICLYCSIQENKERYPIITSKKLKVFVMIKMREH